MRATTAAAERATSAPERVGRIPLDSRQRVVHVAVARLVCAHRQQQIADLVVPRAQVPVADRDLGRSPVAPVRDLAGVQIVDHMRVRPDGLLLRGQGWCQSRLLPGDDPRRHARTRTAARRTAVGARGHRTKQGRGAEGGRVAAPRASKYPMNRWHVFGDSK